MTLETPCARALARLLACAACTTALVSSAPAIAQAASTTSGQAYPTKPIRVIVPYAPGGGADVIARVISQRLAESFGQTVVVDNRSGGGGSIGSETAVRATPDGYTLALVSGAYSTMSALYKLPYDPVKDITPIVQIGEASSIAVVHPGVPVKSVKDLVAYARANPGKLNYGSGGTGGFSHLIVALFELMANVRMTHIPYKGTGPALNDVLAGQVQMIFGSTPSTAPHVKSGRLRALGVTSKVRSSAVPDVPPIAETVPGYYAPLLYGLFGPKALPKNIVATWNAQVVKLLQTPDMKDRLVSAGIDPVGGPPEQFREALAADVERWRKVVKAANIKESD